MLPAVKRTDQKWTYSDYLAWDDDQRWELIDGEAYCMNPAPGVKHQRLAGKLFKAISIPLEKKNCEAFFSPFDVRLSNQTQASDNYSDTVVQPDIVVICDNTKLDDKGCNGAPDLVIEITSPTTARMDLTIKFDLYEKYGVKEYWIVHPAEQTLMVFKLQKNGRYGAPDRYADTGKVPVPLLGDLEIDLAEVFGEE